MTKTYLIEDFDQIIQIGTTFEYNWFRGHSAIYNNLTPSVFRGYTPTDLKYIFKPHIELRYAEEFKRNAPSITQNIPEHGSNLEWLFLMQHHGLPTRLLDWTESILVAIFFTVTENQKEDGEIWSMLPWYINERGGIGWVLPLIYRDNHINYLANEIFHNNPAKLRKEMGLKKAPQTPLALQPPMSHARYLAQQSCFTIHPKPQEGKSLTDICDDERYFVRYIIPASLKKKFERNLRSLGVSHRTLFADLENLCKTIVNQENTIAFSQPEHPDFKEYKQSETKKGDT